MVPPRPRRATGMPSGVRVTTSQLRWGQGRRLALLRPPRSQARLLRQQTGAQQLAVWKERQQLVHLSLWVLGRVPTGMERVAAASPWDLWAAPERMAQERRWQL